MKTLSIFLLLAAATSLPARAQSTKPAAPVEAASISPSHRQAAEGLLDAMASADSYNRTIDQILTTQFKQVPAMKKLEPEMRAFFNKYMGWEVVRPEMASFYVQEFTEPELREITKFYLTPVGQKLRARTPQLMQASMEISQRRMQEHAPELQQLIKEKMTADK